MSGDLEGHSNSDWSFPDARPIQRPGNTVVLTKITVELGGTAVLFLIWTSVCFATVALAMPQLQHVQICRASNGVFSKEEWAVLFLTGDCTKHIDFRIVTLMLHIGMLCFRIPMFWHCDDLLHRWRGMSLRHWTAPFPGNDRRNSLKSCNCKQKSSRRLWSSSDNCCTIWMQYGLNTKRLRKTLHTVVFDIDSFLATAAFDFFGLCRKMARTRAASSSAVNG